MKIVVTFVEQRPSNRFKDSWLISREGIGTKAVENAFYSLVLLIPDPWVVTLGPRTPYFFGMQTKNENIVGSHLLQHLDICSIERPDGKRTVECEFHVTRPGSLHSCSRDLFTEIGSGNDN